MSEIVEAISALGTATEELKTAKESFENIRQDTEQRVAQKEAEVESFLGSARGEYSRTSHYVALPEKIVIPALGLTDEQIQSYEYAGSSDYVPTRSDGTLCFGDIVEFSNGFSQLAIPQGMAVYLNLLVNVAGDSNVTQYTKVHLLVERKGTSGFYLHETPTAPYIYENEGLREFEILGRDWEDNYKDRNEIKITNYAISNDIRQGSLRIVNLGASDLEVFGIGIEVRF